MKKYFTIKIKVLDYWIVDNYMFGVNDILYAIVKIGEKLHLMEREIL